MNILLMPSWFPLYNQTGEADGNPIHGIFIIDQIKLLNRSGNNITVFLPTLKGFLRIDKTKLTVGKKEEYTEIRFSFPKLFPFKYGYYLSFNIGCIIGFLLIRYFIVRQRIDLIHAHILFLSGYSSGILKKIFKVPLILTEHSGPFKINNKTEYKLARKTFKRVNALIGVSQDLLENIENYNFKIAKKFVVGNAVDTGYFNPKNDGLERTNTKHIFLNISTIHKYKGLVYLLRAARILIEEGILNFEIWIGGDGPFKSTLKDLAKEYQLTGNVVFLGLLSRSQVRDYLCRADTFVFPSLRETFGLVVAEAMACGIPAIATINGGSENIVTKDTGILVKPGDETPLAEAMHNRISSKTCFDKDAVRDHIIRNYGYESTAKKYMRIWKEINVREAF